LYGKTIFLKKITAITLAFSILLSTLGVNIAVNYCPMKKSYSFSILKNAKSCCCKTSHKGNCCTSKKIVLKKIEDNYVSSQFNFSGHQVDFTFFQYPSFIYKPITFVKEINFYKDLKPPDSPISLSILYRSLLI